MGIIQRQTVKGTFYSYIGVGIGFLTTGILFPKILSTEEIGLLKILVSYSVIFSQLGSLGFSNVINRLFPYFRDKESGHQGFLTLAFIISVIGFLLAILGLEILKPMIIRNNIMSSSLFVEYFSYLVPLIFFTLFFNLLDSYTKAIYDAVVGTILKELVQRLLILLIIGLYYFNTVDLNTFIILYIVALSLPSLLLLFVLIWKNEFKLHMPGSLLDSALKKEIYILCLYGILTGLGTTIILEFNSILVNKYLGLSETGIYATTFFFGTIILIPSRSLIKIASTILADSWKANDLQTIKLIYSKSCITQGLVSILLFALLWVNIENVFHILPPKFESGKWVIFFIGLTNVIEMSTGINSIIIQTSDSYKINTFFIFIFLVLLIVSNIILIPLLGITGAAVGTLISNALSNYLRFVFLKVKYNMQPFDNRILLLIGIGAFSYLIGYIIPTFNNFIIDLGIRSFVTAIIFMVLVLKLKISEDINYSVNQILKTDFF
jgi:O-antigen/teichoic acid export membrane protein